jgi:hypothetical protein
MATKKTTVKKMVAKKPVTAMKKASPMKQAELMDKKTVAKKNPKTGEYKKVSPMKQTNPKTGQKPFYNMSAELATEIDRRTVENKRRKETEVKASSDSSAVAKITKGNMFSKQLAGNAAANKTRWRAGFNDQKVEHSQQQGTGMNHKGGTEAFYRRNQVESETPMPVLNPKTGQHGYNKKDTGRKEAKGPSVYVARYKGYE